MREKSIVSPTKRLKFIGKSRVQTKQTEDEGNLRFFDDIETRSESRERNPSPLRLERERISHHSTRSSTTTQAKGPGAAPSHSGLTPSYYSNPTPIKAAPRSLILSPLDPLVGSNPPAEVPRPRPLPLPDPMAISPPASSVLDRMKNTNDQL
jgi:hypothetical protein